MTSPKDLSFDYLVAAGAAAAHSANAEAILAGVTPARLQKIAPLTPSSSVSRATKYVESPGVATVLTLGSKMCKWPIGDPSSDSFSFCGRRSVNDVPYCTEHARVAHTSSSTLSKSPPERVVILTKKNQGTQAHGQNKA